MSFDSQSFYCKWRRAQVTLRFTLAQIRGVDCHWLVGLKPMGVRNLDRSTAIQGAKSVELFLFQPVVIVDKIEVGTGPDNPS